MQWIFLLLIFSGISGKRYGLHRITRESNICSGTGLLKTDCITCFCINNQVICFTKDCFYSGRTIIRKSLTIDNKELNKKNENGDSQTKDDIKNLNKYEKYENYTRDNEKVKLKSENRTDKIINDERDDNKIDSQEINSLTYRKIPDWLEGLVAFIQGSDQGSEPRVEQEKFRIYPKTQVQGEKCTPGVIYSKGCQACFCSNLQTIRCTNRPCSQTNGVVSVPSDVVSLFPRNKFLLLPKLTSEGDVCTKGKTYRVDCNLCLCLNTGELMCQTKLCQRIDVLNEVMANKSSGMPCEVGQLPSDDCILCSCNKTFDCKPIPGCTPGYYWDQLQGNPDPNRPYVSDLEPKSKTCFANMSYTKSCNDCHCQEDGTLVCTNRICLTHTDVMEYEKNSKDT